MQDAMCCKLFKKYIFFNLELVTTIGKSKMNVLFKQLVLSTYFMESPWDRLPNHEVGIFAQMCKGYVQIRFELFCTTK